MKRTLLFMLLPALFSCMFFLNSRLNAGEYLDDGVLWSTRAEVREMFGEPDLLYSEEEPFRRYRIGKPGKEDRLKSFFISDTIIHDLYFLNREGNNIEFRVYYGEDKSDGGDILRVKEYSIKFLDSPVQLGSIVKIIPEFKPALQAPKVFRSYSFINKEYRLIFVTDKVTELTNRIGSLFVDPDNDIKDWSLAYEVTFCQGEPKNISARSMVDELKVTIDGEYHIGKTRDFYNTELVSNPL